MPSLRQIGSSLNKERKRGTSSLTSEINRTASSLGDEAVRQLSDVVKFSTLNMIDPKGMERSRQAQARAAKEAKKIQVAQQRSAILEGAQLSNAIAMRTKSMRKGGRRSLLSMGETGSLMV